MEKYKITHQEPYAREPVIRRMKDGSLVCLILTGGPKEPANDNVVKIMRSEDDGKTWSEPEILFQHGERACWATEIFTECETPFAFVQTYYAPSTYREIQSHISYCSNDGKTWSEPVSLPCNVQSCSVRQGITMSNGEILFPVYWQESRKGFDWTESKNGNEWMFTTGVIITSDNGKTFYGYGRIALPDAHMWEPNAVEIENGHIIMYIRYSGANAGYLYISESFDYGRTWSDPKKTDIPNADTKVRLVKINGTIVMINNFTSKTGWENRTHLAIATSKDGKNFTKIIDVEKPEEQWLYPHAYVDYTQKIMYLAYENGKTHYLKKYAFEELGV